VQAVKWQNVTIKDALHQARYISLLISILIECSEQSSGEPLFATSIFIWCISIALILLSRCL